MFNVFLLFDKNCQSPLVTKFLACMDKDQFKDFEMLLELTTSSNMRPELKRKHLTTVLKLSGWDLQ